MEVVFQKDGVVQINDAHIIFPHFSGKEDDFHRSGERDFHVLIPDSEIADALVKNGWNVNIKPPREEGDTPFMKLKIKVNVNSFRPPKVYLVSGNKMNELDEETIGMLDSIDIRSADLDIRPYHSRVQGVEYQTAYLSAIRVYQELDRFAAEYAEEEAPEEVPFD